MFGDFHTCLGRCHGRVRGDCSGDRVVWMKYGREGVVEAEVTPGVFIVFFDKGGFRETVRAEELRVL